MGFQDFASWRHGQRVVQTIAQVLDDHAYIDRPDSTASVFAGYTSLMTTKQPGYAD